ncbi:MAG: cytochrome P450 [Myxococcota bacterium]
MSWTEAWSEYAQGIAARALFAHEWCTTRAAYNPLSRASQTDPYPMYRRLRERDPVHRSRVIEGWVLTRYRDIAGVLRDPRFSADERHHPRFEAFRRRRVELGIEAPDAPYDPSMLRLDAPDHTRLRSLVSRAFTARAVDRLAPRIAEIVERRLARVEDGFDVIADLGTPLPVTVIAEMLGVPTHDLERFKHWSDEVVLGLGMSSIDDMRRSQRATDELGEFLGAIAEERRRDPRDDLITGLVQAHEAGDRLTRDEVLSTCTLLLVAGNETTTHLIGNATYALLRHPDQLEWLRSHPEGLEDAVEELLRFDSPVQATSRFATEDSELPGGPRVRRGQQVFLLLGAANRDPEVFHDPDRLDLTAARERHLAFGLGSHFCLGSQLARLEGRIALGSLIRRFPGMKLAIERPRWRQNIILRGLESLPVRV